MNNENPKTIRAIRLFDYTNVQKKISKKTCNYFLVTI